MTKAPLAHFFSQPPAVFAPTAVNNAHLTPAGAARSSSATTNAPVKPVAPKTVMSTLSGGVDIVLVCVAGPLQKAKMGADGSKCQAALCV